MAFVHRPHLPFGAFHLHRSDVGAHRRLAGWWRQPIVVSGAIWTALLAAMFVTYSRLAPEELYHVSRTGIAGGLSRVLVQINFPIALVAIAVVLASLDVLPVRRVLWAVPAIALCAVTAWPGVVDDGDLDARWINVVPAIGVLIAVALAVEAVRLGIDLSPPRPLDSGRFTLGSIAAIVSVPWMAASVGAFLPGTIFLMEEATGGSHAGEVAVHLGHHHGFDGALIVITALLLSRMPIHRIGLGVVTRVYVSLLFGYGLVNFVQDAWNEQIVKRGWSDTTIPSALHPAIAPIWGVVLGAALVALLALHREERQMRRTSS